MVSVITNTGFECTVDERKFADFRVVDCCGVVLGDSDEMQKVVAATKLMHMIMNEKQIDDLCKHVEKDGVASTDDVFMELFDIMEKAKAENSDVKKS